MDLRIGMMAVVVMAASGAAMGAPAEGTELQQVIEPAFMRSTGSREFSIEYVAKVREVPPGTRHLRVWLPVPQESTVQTISEVTFSRKPTRLSTEPKYGNRIAYWEQASPGTEFEVTMRFRCLRQEVRVDLAQLDSDGVDPADAYGVFKRPDALVIVDDEIRQLARKVAGRKEGTLAKGRAIYDYVLGQMTYDKNHAGWGLGSTRHACQVGKGNCTDFHALFNSLCRAEGIASGFEIGLYLPYERHSDEKLGGYHCWALFRVPGKTWVPVDCSEADRNPARKSFFFGGHTSNRVALSTGRDLILEPRQAGLPLNYFLDPYAEADGTVVVAEKSWSYKDLD